MCLKHWHKVPGPMQADIWRAYRSMPSNTPLRSELMESLPFTSAMAEAIEHVARSEGKSEANCFRETSRALLVDMCKERELLAA